MDNLEKNELIQPFSQLTITNIIFSFPTLPIKLEEIVSSSNENFSTLKENLKKQIQDYINKKILSAQMKERKEIKEMLEAEIIKEKPDFFHNKSENWLKNQIESFPNIIIEINKLIDNLTFSEQNRQRKNLIYRIKIKIYKE